MKNVRLCRFIRPDGQIGVGVLLAEERAVLDLTAAGIDRLAPVLASEETLQGAIARAGRLELEAVRLLAPVDAQEVWAVGVTYLRSKAARMEESQFSATAYDRVYDAPRPELFFKATPDKVVGPGAAVGIRNDSRWSVPEPELGLVINAQRRIVGYTIGNDMSARDIEGENLLYLPQAKMYTGSCALGPVIRMYLDEAEARTWGIRLAVLRGGMPVFEGQTRVERIKRTFSELVEYLFRCQSFPHGVVLLTGTGIIPPDAFTLQRGDAVQIEIDGIGTLSNPVVEV